MTTNIAGHEGVGHVIKRKCPPATVRYWLVLQTLML